LFSIDTLKLGDIVVEDVYIVEFKNILGTNFENLSFDCLFSLGTSNVSIENIVTPIELAFKQDLLHHNNFAMYLAKKGGSNSTIILGDNDSDYYNGTILYYHILDSPYYAVNVTDFKLGTVTHSKDVLAIIASSRHSI
jgi:Eukaryotic aspartyl protease